MTSPRINQNSINLITLLQDLRYSGRQLEQARDELQRLNPGVDLERVSSGTSIVFPDHFNEKEVTRALEHQLGGDTRALVQFFNDRQQMGTPRLGIGANPHMMRHNLASWHEPHVVKAAPQPAPAPDHSDRVQSHRGPSDDAELKLLLRELQHLVPGMKLQGDFVWLPTEKGGTFVQVTGTEQAGSDHATVRRPSPASLQISWPQAKSRSEFATTNPLLNALWRIQWENGGPPKDRPYFGPKHLGAQLESSSEPHAPPPRPQAKGPEPVAGSAVKISSAQQPTHVDQKSVAEFDPEQLIEGLRALLPKENRGNAYYMGMVRHELDTFLTGLGLESADSKKRHGQVFDMKTQLDNGYIDGQKILGYHTGMGSIQVLKEVTTGALELLEYAYQGGPQPQDQVDAMVSLTNIVHEALHGFSRYTALTYSGVGVTVEEVSNETATRMAVRKMLAGKVPDGLLPRLPGDIPKGARRNHNGAYDDIILSTLEVIESVTGWDRHQAARALETASFKMKTKEVSVAWLPGKHLDNLVRCIPGLDARQRDLIKQGLREIE